MYLTLPLDAFRMWDLCKTGEFGTEEFEKNIIGPLLGQGGIGPNGKTPLPESSPNFYWEDKQISYSGLTYVNPSIFTNTMKTSSSDYDVTPSPLPIITDVSVIDSDVLWPLDTHATIIDNDMVAPAKPSTEGNKKPYIECLYYVTMGIKTWSPGLAFLYLATPDSPRDPAVYQQIVNDTNLVPSEYVGDLCNQKEMTQCQKLITDNCNMVYTNDNFNFSPDAYFLLYNGRASKGVCACVNSSLVPPGENVRNNRAAMCFDQNCNLSIPNTTPIINMDELLDLNDPYCRSRCNKLNSLLQGQASNIENLDVAKYKRLCGKSITTTFNTSFFIQLLVPTILITAIIPLGFGINKASIIITVLTLLTLTGVSFYLGKLFAQMTECDGIKRGGTLPDCVSTLNNDMELPLSFCDINMFCECRFDIDCNEGCSCKSGVCVDKKLGKRATETVYVKTINVQMLVLSSSLLILIPIIFHLLRKRFFPKLSTFLSFCFLVMSISICGTFIYLSLVYRKPRISYKGICGQAPTPTPTPTPGPAPGPAPSGPCESLRFEPGVQDAYIGLGVELCGDADIKCPNNGAKCGEIVSTFAKKNKWDPTQDYSGCVITSNDKSRTLCLVSKEDKTPFLNCNDFLPKHMIAECKS